MRRRGFTLVELLVVIAIIALLVSILMPALGRARELAKRVQCQSNLSACGRSLEMYKNEFKDKMPKPWFQSAVDTIGMPTWQSFGAARRQVGDFNQNTSTQTISLPYFLNPNWNTVGYLNPAEKQNVGLCLYMLVRQEGTDPKSFLCPSAENDREMSLEAIGSYALTSYQFKVALWRDLQNFQCGYNLSYSYHDPWNSFGAQEDSAVMADKSNAFDSANMRYDATRLGGKTGGSLYPSRLFTNQQFAPLENADATWTDFEGTNVNHGNSRNHKTECQNILYMNSSVKRGENPLMGMGGDNIYTRWWGPTGAAGQIGMYINSDKQIMGQWGNSEILPVNPGWWSRGRADSYLGN